MAEELARRVTAYRRRRGASLDAGRVTSPLVWLRQMGLYTIPRRRTRRCVARQPKIGSGSKRHHRDTGGALRSIFPAGGTFQEWRRERDGANRAASVPGSVVLILRGSPRGVTSSANATCSNMKQANPSTLTQRPPRPAPPLAAPASSGQQRPVLCQSQVRLVRRCMDAAPEQRHSSAPTPMAVDGQIRRSTIPSFDNGRSSRSRPSKLPAPPRVHPAPPPRNSQPPFAVATLLHPSLVRLPARTGCQTSANLRAKPSENFQSSPGSGPHTSPSVVMALGVRL